MCKLFIINFLKTEIAYVLNIFSLNNNLFLSRMMESGNRLLVRKVCRIDQVWNQEVRIHRGGSKVAAGAKITGGEKRGRMNSRKIRSRFVNYIY